MQCERCKKEFQGENWQKVCKQCYVITKNGTQPRQAFQRGIETEKSIVKQVLYKVAAELLDKGTPATKVNEFVKELELGFYQ